MSKFVEFKGDDYVLALNIDRIDGFVKKTDNNTAIYVGGSEIPFYVAENVEGVLSKINSEMYRYQISL